MNPTFMIFLYVFALVSETTMSLLFEPYIYSASLRAERQDLLEIRDSLSSTVNLHSNWTGPPCYKNNSRWIGIRCSKSRVIAINLPGIQLTGSLSSTSLQNVARLKNLDLSDNALHGYLPTFKNLVHLKVVSFSENRFSGPIPIEFVSLPNLTRLELQENFLNGTIPAFNQKSLSAFNVSYNFLQGEIPETRVLQRFSRGSFEHNLELCGPPLDNPCAGPAPSPSVPVVPSSPPSPSSPSGYSGPRGLELWGLILIAVSMVLVPVVIFFCFFFYYKKNQKDDADAKDKDLGAIQNLAAEEVSSEFSTKKARSSRANRPDVIEFYDESKRAFNYDELLRSSAEVLGKGKLGVTYRTTLDSGSVVAVKRFRNMDGLSKKDFFQQMQLLGTLKHENIVEIVAYYHSKDEKFVIYEIADGSLGQLIHDNRGAGRLPLTWNSRLNIIKGIARGLHCLHTSPLASHKVPHANLKSSNILVNCHNHRHYTPKLTDFGFLPLLISPHHAQKFAIARTPEFKQGKRLSQKSDIYCFGLVLLEIITGRQPEYEDGDLPTWVASVIMNNWSTDVLDIEIVGEKESLNGMLKLVDIALQCTASEPVKRPDVGVLVERIEEIREGT